MVPRVCAVWLVTLILAPFSAPFSVGDISPSLKNATTHALPVARSPLRVKRVLHAAARAHVARTVFGPAISARHPHSSALRNTPRVLPLRM